MLFLHYVLYPMLHDAYVGLEVTHSNAVELSCFDGLERRL